MSKIDIIPLLEWAERQRAFKEPKVKRFSRRKLLDEEFDPVKYIRAREEELEELHKYLKDKEKLNKKEDKKPEGYKFTFVEGMLIAFMAQYFLGPIISTALKHSGVQ